MSRFVRPSKYRHVFGQSAKKECASASYVAHLNWNSSGGGAFAILPSRPLPPIAPQSPIQTPGYHPARSWSFCPVVAKTDVCLWKVEESQFENWGAENGSHATLILSRQLLARALDCRRWTSGSGTWLTRTEAKIALTDIRYDSVADLEPDWNALGHHCRDRKIRLFDPRAGSEAVRIGDGHAGIKGARMSERQLALWDTSSLAIRLSIDQSSGVIMPFWRQQRSVPGWQGVGAIHASDGPKLMFDYAETVTSGRTRMCFLPRRALSVSDCEIMRAYKVYGSTIEPIGFVVPRKSDQFQSDIFPPAPSSEPALTAAEWFTGKTAPQNLVDLDTGTVSAAPASAPATFAPQPTPAAAAPPPAAAPKPVDPPTPASIPIPPTPAAAQTPIATEAASPSNEANSALVEENSRLTSELREARAQIRNLELQIEAMKANAQKAAKAILEAGGI
ncbi:WD repeat coronin family [Rhizoctonia solani]|uniref:WD repeat coronin family n=1 Tax=Rhizoctonia solani TaxID=456999 RepID=A0A8H7IF45_9AGAM|nr:WD repeat coronin family [Rhizoctonia solani]